MIRLALQSIHEENNQIFGHEVLARKIVDDGRVLAPGAFMARASDDEWHDLDLRVYQLVLQSPLLIKDPWPLFINISPATLKVDSYFNRAVDLLSAIVKSRKAPTVIEISEESEMAGRSLDDRLDTIKSMGAKIAMDDFGVGYSDLIRLVEHEWSFCKIDISSLKASVDYESLVDAKAYCDSRNIVVVLERYESKDSKFVMHPFHKSLYQGYAYSKPYLMSELASSQKCRAGQV
jgi:EAL domain-containing protein (putative c-di-GMP-specific phosphodiesterase class I)